MAPALSVCNTANNDPMDNHVMHCANDKRSTCMVHLISMILLASSLLFNYLCEEARERVEVVFWGA